MIWALKISKSLSKMLMSRALTRWLKLLKISDIGLLDNTWDGIKQLTKRVQTEAEKMGLSINPDKTKVMKIGKWHQTDRIVIG